MCIWTQCGWSHVMSWTCSFKSDCSSVNRWSHCQDLSSCTTEMAPQERQGIKNWFNLTHTMQTYCMHIRCDSNPPLLLPMPPTVRRMTSELDWGRIGWEYSYCMCLRDTVVPIMVPFLLFVPLWSPWGWIVVTGSAILLYLIPHTITAGAGLRPRMNASRDAASARLQRGIWLNSGGSYSNYVKL